METYFWQRLLCCWLVEENCCIERVVVSQLIPTTSFSNNKRKCTIATAVCLHSGFSHLYYLIYFLWVDIGLWIVGGYSGLIVDSGRIVDSGYAYLMLMTHQKISAQSVDKCLNYRPFCFC